MKNIKDIKKQMKNLLIQNMHTDNFFALLLCKKILQNLDRNVASSRPVPHNRLFLFI